MMSLGPASSEVPVSTATRQSWHKLMPWLSKVMSEILTSQYPDCWFTGTQNSSDAMCSRLISPKLISETSSSELARKTLKTGSLRRLLDVIRAMRLNSGPCAMESRARPSTPSNLKDANGWSLSSVAARKTPGAQRVPTQMLSCTHFPLIFPVPNVIESSSLECPSSRGLPSQLTSLKDVDLDLSKRT